MKLFQKLINRLSNKDPVNQLYYSHSQHHEKKLEEAKTTGDAFGIKYHNEQLEKAKELDIEALKHALVICLQERKTPTRQVFNAVMADYHKSVEAIVHQKILGIDPKSEIARIVWDNHHQVYAQLLAVVFEDLGSLSEDQVEQICLSYLKKIKEGEIDERHIRP